MGRGKQAQPKRISEKVRDIRLKLELTQEEMFEKLSRQDIKIHPGYVSLYETGERIPGLLVVLAYARAAGISTDFLIDDALDLPSKIGR